MATYSRGYRVPEVGDPNAVPGDLVALVETVVPAMTTAEIAALSWARKPAGWQAFDTTKSKLVRSTGAAMVDVLDTGLSALVVSKGKFWGNSGGAIVEATPDGDVVLVAGTSTLRVANSGAASCTRATQSGDATTALVTKGYADGIAARFKAGYHTDFVWSGSNTTTVTLPAVPSGFTAWSVTANLDTATPRAVSVSVSGTTATFKVADTSSITGVHWQAIAY
jgi:hypothetical protein